MNLIGFPNDIIACLAFHLSDDPQSLMNFSMTCKKIGAIINKIEVDKERKFEILLTTFAQRVTLRGPLTDAALAKVQKLIEEKENISQTTAPEANNRLIEINEQISAAQIELEAARQKEGVSSIPGDDMYEADMILNISIRELDDEIQKISVALQKKLAF